MNSRPSFPKLQLLINKVYLRILYGPYFALLTHSPIIQCMSYGVWKLRPSDSNAIKLTFHVSGAHYVLALGVTILVQYLLYCF